MKFRCERQAPGGRGSVRVAVAIMLGAVLCVPMVRSAQAGILEGVNHTHWAINRFSVDGRSGMDTIGPWQGGGGGHYSVAAQWRAGMTVLVDWETGVAGTKGFPGFGDDYVYEAWASKLRAQKRQLSRTVPVPDYTGQSTCGLTVHFLPCDEIQVTTSCHRYGSPEYPIKIPLKLPEPQSCPATDHLPAQGASR